MAKHTITDEQFRALHRRNQDFLRRVDEGDIPYDNAMEILQRAINGHGYLGNQILEGDDIRLAIEGMKSFCSEVEIMINATAMAATGARYDRVPARYRIIASIVIDDLQYNGTSISQYVRGRFFHYLPNSRGCVFDYWHDLVSGHKNSDFPSTTVDPKDTEFVERMLTNIGGPILETVQKGTTLYLTQDGRVLTSDGVDIS